MSIKITYLDSVLSSKAFLLADVYERTNILIEMKIRIYAVLYRMQTLIWVGLNILINFILNLISLLAWCTFFFHSFMMILMVVIMSWYGASYYLDYFAYLALRKAVENNEVSAPREVNSPTEMENERDEDVEVDETLRHNLESALEEENSSDIEV